jgi:hypothetical protein
MTRFLCAALPGALLGGGCRALPPPSETILWAGRGRRILGLHVSKHVCSKAQAHMLLQKAIDAVP